ncbi:MAG: hypothetical protein ABEJ43_01255 [Haloferacaceae archaeon]
MPAAQKDDPLRPGRLILLGGLLVVVLLLLLVMVVVRLLGVTP